MSSSLTASAKPVSAAEAGTRSMPLVRLWGTKSKANGATGNRNCVNLARYLGHTERTIRPAEKNKNNKRCLGHAQKSNSAGSKKAIQLVQQAFTCWLKGENKEKPKGRERKPDYLTLAWHRSRRSRGLSLAIAPIRRSAQGEKTGR